MAKALISTKERVQSISSWVQITSTNGDTPVDENTPKTWDPVWTDIANSQRIAQVTITIVQTQLLNKSHTLLNPHKS